MMTKNFGMLLTSYDFLEQTFGGFFFKVYKQKMELEIGKEDNKIQLQNYN